MESQQLTASELLSDARLVGELRRAYDESGVGSNHPVEQGGFIVVDTNSDLLDIVRLPAQGRDSFSFPICSDGVYGGRKIVGSFHTHPNSGTEWRQEPSVQDIRLSQNYPDTMGRHQFVIAESTIYHIDNDGVVTEMGPTSRLLVIR
jgi:hypothetical protein